MSRRHSIDPFLPEKRRRRTYQFGPPFSRPAEPTPEPPNRTAPPTAFAQTADVLSFSEDDEGMKPAEPVTSTGLNYPPLTQISLLWPSFLLPAEPILESLNGATPPTPFAQTANPLSFSDHDEVMNPVEPLTGTDLNYQPLAQISPLGPPLPRPAEPTRESLNGRTPPTAFAQTVDPLTTSDSTAATRQEEPSNGTATPRSSQRRSGSRKKPVFLLKPVPYTSLAPDAIVACPRDGICPHILLPPPDASSVRCPFCEVSWLGREGAQQMRRAWTSHVRRKHGLRVSEKLWPINEAEIVG